MMVKVLNNLGNIYNGAAIGLRRESDANGFEAIEHRLRQLRNMMTESITNTAQQHDLMRRRV